MSTRANPVVYLAGPISGMLYGEAVDWRDRATDEFARDGIVAYSPMRAKEYLDNQQRLVGDPDAYKDMGLSNSKGIVTRDRFDTMTASLVLMNLLPAEDQAKADREQAATLMYLIQRGDRGTSNEAESKLMGLIHRLSGRGNTSIGTVLEAGWADAFRVPLVVVMTKENAHNHAMLNEVAGYIVTTLDAGIAMAKAFLLPGERASEAYKTGVLPYHTNLTQTVEAPAPTTTVPTGGPNWA